MSVDLLIVRTFLFESLRSRELIITIEMNIIPQGIVREDLRFIDVNANWPRKVHNARVMRHSVWANPLVEMDIF